MEFLFGHWMEVMRERIHLPVPALALGVITPMTVDRGAIRLECNCSHSGIRFIILLPAHTVRPAAGFGRSPKAGRLRRMI